MRKILSDSERTVQDCVKFFVHKKEVFGVSLVFDRHDAMCVIVTLAQKQHRCDDF